MNTSALWPSVEDARQRVLTVQSKSHQWSINDPNKQFDDLYNLILDPAFLVLGWSRVIRNKGGRTAGVDGTAPRGVDNEANKFLAALRNDLKARRFCPLPVRQRMIPKAGGKVRALGIPTARDRAVQAALNLVVEPIFEADFQNFSYGFRPNRRAQDAIAEIHYFGTPTRGYDWVLEGDIKACFDEIDHTALLLRVRRRVVDRRVIALIKSFLKSGILNKDGVTEETAAGTPQGGILSPLLSNIALHALDEHFAKAWKAMGDSSARRRRRIKGLATYRLVRYADDFVVMVKGERAHAIELRDEVADVLKDVGLRLSAEKTKIVHLDEGFDFLGFHIKRQSKRGCSRHCVYTYPSRKALANVLGKVKHLTRGSTNQPLSVLCGRLAPVLRGWATYFQHGVSKATFDYVRTYTWRRVVVWLRSKHPHASWKELRRRYLADWWPCDRDARLFDIGKVSVTRYRYRGASIPSPWPQLGEIEMMY